MTKQLAIIGAGPIGIETAAYAAQRDVSIAIYEKGEIGEHVRHWGHVRFFSTWLLNRSAWGMARLRALNAELRPDSEYPTGHEYLRHYLMPLARSLEGSVDIHRHTEVVGVARQSLLKDEYIGDERRGDDPFLLRVAGPEGTRFDTADIVIDTTGVLAQPNALGRGGLPALGEGAIDDQILRQIPDVADQHRRRLKNRRILVVGAGHSALTTLDLLSSLRSEAANTEIFWSFRDDINFRTVLEDDPLPERQRLDRFANAASRGEVDGIGPLPQSTVHRLTPVGDAIDVTLERPQGPRTIGVDQIIANVGYRPDTSLFRELQVHLCYATEGPMTLAATLLAAKGADCLDQPSSGIDTLENPEPNFFILGAKSYGRNSNFLLQAGFEQIETVFDALSAG